MEAMPVLYSFRRCPYAIRARLGLRAAGLEPGRSLEIREVDLRCRPPELIQASAKATVPVLLLPDGRVLDESLAILEWALEPLRSNAASQNARETQVLLDEADGPFKHHLDRWRYPERFGISDRSADQAALLAILRRWNRRLEPGGWLLGHQPSLVDIALLPFVRQFHLSDPGLLAAEPDLAAARGWLQRFLASPELAAVMEPPWGLRDAWRSPRWLYHLALADDWRLAKQQGQYPWSTRGARQEAAGFVHLCRADQILATWQRFYADAGPVRLLTLDPAALLAAGLALRDEPAPGSGEPFPHLFGGTLPLQAVRGDAPFRPAAP